MAFYQDGSAFDPLFGDGSDGASTWSGDSAANINATTLSVTAAQTPASGVIIRCTSTFIPSSSGTITVDAQSGQAIGSHPAVCGGYGVPLGAIMAAIGSTAIPPLMRPGDDTASRTAGWLQILAKGNVQIDKAMTLNATAADASCGGAGGGLLVIVSAGTISGSAEIQVKGVQGNDTGAAKSGGGGYSGEPGGHAGYGGSGGGGAGNHPSGNQGGAGGAGIMSGNSGGTGALNGGAGGGSIDNAGANYSGGGGDGGDVYLGDKYGRQFSADTYNSQDGTTGAGGDTAGTGGVNMGGGGGGTNSVGYNPGGDGGDAGSGGGGGGYYTGYGWYFGGAGGHGTMFPLPSKSPYAGMPGGQGGGGGGGGVPGGGGRDAAGGNGGAGISALSAATGAGDGGNGAVGIAGGVQVNNATTFYGGAGGAGGNGGGAAGLCIMIAPSITYSGTVTGRHIKIEGAGALKFIKGFSI